MEFKEWLDEKIIGEIDGHDIDASIDRSSIVHFMPTWIDVLEKVYNVYKDTNILDRIDVYSFNHEYYNLAITQKSNFIEIDVVFDTMRFLNYNKIFTTLTKDIFSNHIPIHKADSENFYVLLTLDPYKMNLDYIKEVEDVLNENITLYTNMDLLYEEFKNLIDTDAEFKLLIETNLEVFNIIQFESLKEYSKYFVSRDGLIEDLMYNERDIINKLQSILPEGVSVLTPDGNNLNLEDILPDDEDDDNNPGLLN